MTDAAPRPVLSRSRKVAFSVVTALVVVLVLEGLCRLTEPTQKYRFAALTGFELVPGYSARRSGHETVNALGLRGAETTEKKAAGAFRILAMGGSTTWGHKVEDDETWPVALEARLRETGHRGVEVLNGGVSGWGLEQIVLSLEGDRLARLEPDLVIVYEGWNHPLRRNPLAERYARMAKDAPDGGFLSHFAIARWIARRQDDAAAGRGGGGAEGGGRAQERLAEIRRREIPGLVDRLAALCRERRVPLALVAYPALVQCPLPDPSHEDDRRRWAETLGDVEDTGPALTALVARYADEYASAMDPIRAGAARDGVPLLDVAERMRAAAAGGAGAPSLDRWLPWFKDRMHLTPEGNRALAAALAGELEAAKLVR